MIEMNGFKTFRVWHRIWRDRLVALALYTLTPKITQKLSISGRNFQQKNCIFDLVSSARSAHPKSQDSILHILRALSSDQIAV